MMAEGLNKNSINKEEIKTKDMHFPVYNWIKKDRIFVLK
jgi:hypothetical protein